MKIQLEVFERILNYPMYVPFQVYNMDEYNTLLKQLIPHKDTPHKFFENLNDELDKNNYFPKTDSIFYKNNF